jgi:sensory rhodopsin
VNEVATFFLIGTVGMAIGTFAFAYAFLTDPGNRVYHGLLTLVPGIAFVAYALMALRLDFQIVTVGDRVVDVARYVDWLLTTPLIIAYLGLLSGVSRRYLVGLVFLDVLVMGAGLAGALSTGVFRWVWFAVGMVLYVPFLYGLTAGINKAVADRPAPVRALFEKLRNLTVVIWFIYPVAWVLGTTGLGFVSYPIQVMVVTYADLIAKVGFGFIAVNSQQALGQLPRLDALGSIRIGGPRDDPVRGGRR